MEINNFFLLENFMLDVNGLQIKKGDIITGEVLDMSADTILLNLEDIGEIEGKNGLNTDYLNFGKLKFLVKSYSNGKIELEPILNEKTHETNPEKFENKKITDKIFREYDILEDKISEKLVENLLKYKLPVNKENISIGLKTIDKLEKIFQNKNGKDIVLFKNNNTPIKKEEIRNFVFINKDDNNTSGDLKFIYDNIESMFEEGQLSDNCIKSIVFLIKNDIKVSINNLEKLFLILEGKEIISEEALDFLYSQDLEIKEQKLTKKDSLIFNNKKLFTLAEKDVSYIKKYYKEINEKLKQINNEIKIGNLSIDKEVKKHIRDLSDSLDFLNEINKEMIFAYIPIRSITKGEKGTISILKKRRGNFEKDDKLNVFINLHMEYLNKVKIYFEAVGNLINIKFNIKEENIGLFKENETRLSNALKNNGYKLNSISYIEDKDISFLDTLIDNHNSYYYLDVRV